jgi:hypothetical protein
MKKSKKSSIKTVPKTAKLTSTSKGKASGGMGYGNGFSVAGKLASK